MRSLCHVRHAGSLLGRMSNWLQRLQDARGWRDGRTHVGTDERGNNYFVKLPTSGMVAETSHVKEIRSIEYAGGNHWKECKYLTSYPAHPVHTHSAETHIAPCVSADDPDMVPVEWRLWLSGQQRLPPNEAAPSGANSTLDRLEELPMEERLPLGAPADAQQMEPALLENLQNASGAAVRTQSKPGDPTRMRKRGRYQPQSWQGRGPEE